jgi:hypothetical protein
VACSLSARLGSSLLLNLGRGGGLSLLRLEKVLVAKEDDKHQQGEANGGAHIAAATAAAGRTLGLQIWIANFGQRILPVR